MPAKHVQIARDEGMGAGLTAFLSAPSSRLSKNWTTIVGNGRRNEASMLKHYESCFANTVGKTRPSKNASDNDVLADRTLDDKQSLIEALVEALGIDPEAVSALTIGVTADDDEPEPESGVESNDEFITRDVAWVLLGANDEFRSTPANRSEAASNGQMYRLNAEGLISKTEVARLNDEAGA